MNLIKEKGELENKIIELEAQKSVVDQKARQYESQVAGLESRNSALYVLLKIENEQTKDITPLTK